MAEIQLVRFIGRTTLDPALVRHVAGRSRPVTARPVEAEAMGEIVDLGGDVRSAVAALDAARPTGRGGKPYEAVEALIGGPPPYGDDLSWPPDRELAWAYASYDWLLSILGPRATVVTATLHRDETSPHVHALFVPLDSGGVLRWTGVQKDAMARLGVPPRSPRKKAPTPYRIFQDDYQARVGVRFGLGRGEVGSIAKHEPIDRAKAVERRLAVARFREEAARSRARMHEDTARLAEEREEAALTRAIEVEAATGEADVQVSESLVRRDEALQDLYDTTARLSVESESVSELEAELAEAQWSRDAAREEALRVTARAEEVERGRVEAQELAARKAAEVREAEERAAELAVREEGLRRRVGEAEAEEGRLRGVLREREEDAKRLRAEREELVATVEAGRRDLLGRAGQRGAALVEAARAAEEAAGRAREEAERERGRADEAERARAAAVSQSQQVEGAAVLVREELAAAKRLVVYLREAVASARSDVQAAYARGVRRGVARGIRLVEGAVARHVLRRQVTRACEAEAKVVDASSPALRHAARATVRDLVVRGVGWWRGEHLRRPRQTTRRWWRELWLLPSAGASMRRGRAAGEGEERTR